MSTVPNNDEQLREAVRNRYAQTALQVLGGSEPTSDACCGSTCCSTSNGNSCCSTVNSDAITNDLYSHSELGALPVAAALASLGCGNPTALAELKTCAKVL